MIRKRVPRKIWDYGYRYVCKNMHHTASYAGRLNSRTSNEKVTGDIPDIVEFLDFGFYDRCWFQENAGLGETLHGRWL